MENKIQVIFDDAWVMSKRAEAVLPVIALINGLPSLFPCKVQEQTFTQCTLVAEGGAMSPDDMIKKISDFLKQRFSLDSIEGIAKINFLGTVNTAPAAPSAAPAPTAPAAPASPAADPFEAKKAAILAAMQRKNGGGEDPKKASVPAAPVPPARPTPSAPAAPTPPAAPVTPTSPSAPSIPPRLIKKAEPVAPVEEAASNGKPVDDTPQKETAIEKINALIGAEEFKALANECVTVAPGLIKHETREAFTHQCFLFSINPGNGLTTYLTLFADLLNELQLFQLDMKDKISEVVLPSPQNLSNDKKLISYASSQFITSRSGGRVVCVDISEWMTCLTDKRFRDFLTEIDDQLGKNIIVFRVPFVEKEIMNRLHRALGDVLSIRDISFVPFNHEELTAFARLSLSRRGFSMEEDAWEVFHARITEEKNDGRFYGINTVNKLIREMLYLKHLHNALGGFDNTVLKKQEILSLATTLAEDEKSGLEMLSDMIGMESIRTRVEEIVGQIVISLKNKKLDSPCIHMRFVGNPGTGKTTVARVIGKILKEKGILRNGNFFEYAGRDFCGRFVGETAPKTAAMCRDAYGSVLFIDEAYSLYRAEGYSTSDFGREAIDTLIAEMENHRNDLVVIMAGYTEEMEHLMKGNAGLASRMPYVIEFPNYTRDQLYAIFMQMVKKSFQYLEGFEEAVKEYFDTIPDEVLESKEFSNARFVRNLFERTWGKAVMRAQLNKEDTAVLTKEDFLLASSEKEFKQIMQKQPRSLGFI